MTIKANSRVASKVPSAKDVLPLILYSPEVVFADIETTGFGEYSDIIEIGAIRLDISSGKIKSKFNSLCHLKRQNKVPAKVISLTGITTVALETAPRLETVLTAFREFIRSSPVSFHNAAFDWSILSRKYLALGIQLNNSVICTKKLFNFLHPKLPCNLASVAQFYGHQITGQHRAYIDSKWAAACYQKMRFELIDKLSPPSLSPPQAMFLSQSTQPEIREISYDDLSKTCRIYRIAGWKKGRNVRIYCTTNLADLFYDIGDDSWNISNKKTELNIDVQVLSKYILDFLGLDLPQFQAKYLPA